MFKTALSIPLIKIPVFYTATSIMNVSEPARFGIFTYTSALHQRLFAVLGFIPLQPRR